MKTDYNIDEQRYKIAQKRVEKIRGFYNHLIIYLVINALIVYFNINNLEDGETYFQWRNFITFSIWGFFLLLHAASTFIPNFIFGVKWEERKIEQFMNEESKYRSNQF